MSIGPVAHEPYGVSLGDLALKSKSDLLIIDDEVADVNPDTIKNPEGAKVIVVTCESRPDGKVSTKQYKAYLAKLQENPNFKAPLQHNTEKKHKQKCKKFNKARMKNKIFNDEMIHNMRVQQKQELEAEQALVTAPSLLA